MDYHMAHNDEKQASVFSHDIYIWQDDKQSIQFIMEMVFMMKLAMHISNSMKSLFVQ
jgi:hypothetical protein